MTYDRVTITVTDEGALQMDYHRRRGDEEHTLLEQHAPESAWENRVLFHLDLHDAVGKRIEARRKREEPFA